GAAEDEAVGPAAGLLQRPGRVVGARAVAEVARRLVEEEAVGATHLQEPAAGHAAAGDPAQGGPGGVPPGGLLRLVAGVAAFAPVEVVVVLVAGAHQRFGEAGAEIPEAAALAARHGVGRERVDLLAALLAVAERAGGALEGLG